MATTREPLLNLETLTEVSTVLIDKVAYPIIGRAQLTIIKYRAFTRDYARLTALHNKPDLTVEEDAEYETLVNRLVALILDAPDKVRAKLRGEQLMAIIGAFLTLSASAGARSRANRTLPAKPQKNAKKKTGANSSRRSSGSTAGVH
jgi:hypothetical protein